MPKAIAVTMTYLFLSFAAVAADLDVTFIVTSDIHVSTTDTIPLYATNHATAMKEMKTAAGTRLTWPQGYGKAGMAIDRPAAVFVAGDISYDNYLWRDSPSWKAIAKLYTGAGHTMDGTTFLGAGNHDVQTHFIRYALQTRNMNDHLSSLIRSTFDSSVVAQFNPGSGWSAPHYAVRLGEGARLLVVQLNTSIGEPCRSIVGAGGNTHGFYRDPTESQCDALGWLDRTIADHVKFAKEGARVIIVQHYGYDSSGLNIDRLAYRGYWWAPDVRKAFEKILAAYGSKILAVVAGHSHGLEVVARGTTWKTIGWGEKARTSETLDAGWADGGRAWANVNADPAKERELSFCRVISISGSEQVRCTTIVPTPKREMTAQVDGGVPVSRAFVDVDGDGRADFCRVLGKNDGGQRQISCRLNGLHGWTRESGPTTLDVGYAEGRAWVDVNGDRRADFCRVVDRNGLGGRIRCALADTSGTFADKWESAPSAATDVGFKAGRAWVDVDRDGNLDYCSIIENAGLRVQCITSMKSGRPATAFQGDFITSTKINTGYDATHGWADMNGDGRADFCRVLQSETAIGQIGCLLSGDGKFTTDVLSLYSADSSGAGDGYNVGYHEGLTWADFNGDGRADFCRVVEDNAGARGRVECTLAGMEDGKDAWLAGLRSLHLDPGEHRGRAFIDFDGDKRSDYCRVVGGNTAVCTLVEDTTGTVPATAFNVGTGLCVDDPGFVVFRVTGNTFEALQVKKIDGCSTTYAGLVEGVAVKTP